MKFALGLTTGMLIGGAGTMILAIVGIIALEDSPEVLDTLKHMSDNNN